MRVLCEYAIRRITYKKILKSAVKIWGSDFTADKIAQEASTLLFALRKLMDVGCTGKGCADCGFQVRTLPLIIARALCIIAPLFAGIQRN